MTRSQHADLSEFLPYLLFQAAEVTSRDFQKHYQARYGMLRTEWRVLFHLGQFGDQTAKQICQRASMHKTKVSRAVKALEQKRFLRRTTSSNDRRSEILSLTKHGQATLSDLSRHAEAYTRATQLALGADRLADLTETLHLLIAERAGQMQAKASQHP